MVDPEPISPVTTTVPLAGASPNRASAFRRVTRWIKGFPIARWIEWKTRYLASRIVYGRDVAIVEDFSLFAPNWGGSYRVCARLTTLGAQQTFPFLAGFLAGIGRKLVSGRATHTSELYRDADSENRALQLKRAFDKYGSDKATTHDYHYIYSLILKNPDAVTDVLEIGLGTNNTDVVSHMGRDGRPGASLRAFREYLPNARVYGADVDRRILFEEDRIKTFFVDQTDLSSFEAFGESLRGCAFDLIIDDGLHAPNANIATLGFALHRLKPGGWFAVEDIPERALPVWDVVEALLPAGYRAHLFFAKAGLVFAVEKLAGAEQVL